MGQKSGYDEDMPMVTQVTHKQVYEELRVAELRNYNKR